MTDEAHLKSLETTLSSKFSTEMAELKAIQAEVEKRRAEEAQKKQEAHDQLLQNILQGQADAIAEKAKMRDFVMKKILAPIAAIVAAIAAIYVGTGSKIPDVKTRDVKDQVEASAKSLDSRMEKLEERIEDNDKIHERMVEIQLDQQVEMSESTEYLSKKIEAISSRAEAVEVAAYPAVSAGQKKAEAIKKARSKAPKYDPADPLADLKK